MIIIRYISDSLIFSDLLSSSASPSLPRIVLIQTIRYSPRSLKEAKRVKTNLAHLDTVCIGESWSRDGSEGVLLRSLQSAQLVHSRLTREEDPVSEEDRNGTIWLRYIFSVVMRKACYRSFIIPDCNDIDKLILQ